MKINNKIKNILLIILNNRYFYSLISVFVIIIKISLILKLITLKNTNKVNRRKDINKPTRVLHINTNSFKGGAANVCYDIFNAEIFKDVSQSIFCKKNDIPGNMNIFELKYSFISKLLFKIGKIYGIQDIIGNIPNNLFNSIQYKESTTIHIHNLHGDYFNYFLLNRISREKKIIWTLHDMHCLTGHCAHSFNCNNWKSGCGNCPDLSIYPSVRADHTRFNAYIKNNILNKTKIIFASPSNWLYENFAGKYKNKDILLIRNEINNKIFKKYDRSQLIDSELIKDKFIVVFISDFGIDNPYKGGKYLKMLYEEFKINDSIFWIIVGSKNIKNLKNCLFLDYINDKRSIAEIFSISNLFVYPSLADNCPLVVLESLACQCPVLTFNTGGIPELVNKNNSEVVEKSYDGLRKGFLKFLNNTRENQFENIESNEMYKGYFDLYE